MLTAFFDNFNSMAPSKVNVKRPNFNKLKKDDLIWQKPNQARQN